MEGEEGGEWNALDMAAECRVGGLQCIPWLLRRLQHRLQSAHHWRGPPSRCVPILRWVFKDAASPDEETPSAPAPQGGNQQLPLSHATGYTQPLRRREKRLRRAAILRGAQQTLQVRDVDAVSTAVCTLSPPQGWKRHPIHF